MEDLIIMLALISSVTRKDAGLILRTGWENHYSPALQIFPFCALDQFPEARIVDCGVVLANNKSVFELRCVLKVRSINDLGSSRRTYIHKIWTVK